MTDRWSYRAYKRAYRWPLALKLPVVRYGRCLTKANSDKVLVTYIALKFDCAKSGAKPSMFSSTRQDKVKGIPRVNLPYLKVHNFLRLDGMVPGGKLSGVVVTSAFAPGMLVSADTNVGLLRSRLSVVSFSSVLFVRSSGILSEIRSLAVALNFLPVHEHFDSWGS